MTRFVESAVLRVVDQSTPNVRKIDKALAALFRTANKLAGAKIGRALSGIQMPAAASGARSAIAALGAAYDRAASRASSFASAAQRVNSALSSQAALASRAASAVGGIRAQRPGGQAQQSQTSSRRSRLPFEETFRRAAVWRAANDILSASQRAARSGGIGILDEGTDRLRAQQHNLPKDIQKAIDAGSAEASRQFRTLTQAMINETTRAAVGNLDNMTPANAKALASIIANSMTSEIVRTGDYEEAKRSSQRGAKFADLIASASDPTKLSRAMDTWTRILIAGGNDMKSSEVLSGFKGMKTLGASLSRQATIKAGLMFDETGQRGGNELFQFVDSFMGQRITKQAYAKQVKEGLRDAAGNVVDASLLATDAFAWIEKNLKPRLQKKGIKFDDTEADRANIIQEAKKFGLRGTAENFIARELIKLDERKKALEKAMRANLSEAFNLAAPSQSIAASLSAVTKQFQVFSDRMTSDVQPAISGALDKLSVMLAKSAENISGAGKLTTVAGAAAVLAGAQIAKYVIDNPGQSALTAAVVANTAAVNANTVSRALPFGVGAGAGALAMLKRAGLYGTAVVGGIEVGNAIGGALRNIGKVAGGKNYIPKSDETRQEIAGEIERLNAKIDGILGRVHSSRRDAFNPEVDRLRGEVQVLKNRLAVGDSADRVEAFQKFFLGIKSVLPPQFGGDPSGKTIKERVDAFVAGLDDGGNKAKEKLANVGTTIEGAGNTIVTAGQGVASGITGAGGAVSAALEALAAKISSVGIQGPAMPRTGTNALGLR